MSTQLGIELGLGAGLLAILYGVFLASWVLARPAGNATMQSIAGAIQEGAMAFLRRQYQTIAVVAVVLAIVIAIAPPLGWEAAVGFLIGATLSGAAGYIGMLVSVRANVRTAEAARGGLRPALQLAFRGGAVTGLLVVGLGLFAVSGYYAIMLNVNHGDEARGTELLGKAFELAPKRPEIAYHYAAALKRSGNPTRAKDVLGPALEVKTSFTDRPKAEALYKELGG